MKDSCGIFGVWSKDRKFPASFVLFNGLMSLQHRGQDSCGICVQNEGGLKLVKDMGLVSDVFDKRTLKKMRGTVAIGQVRYPTTGGGSIKNAQPFIMSLTRNEFAFAFNGNIANYEVLRKKLMGKGLTFVSTSEMELIGMLLSHALNKKDNIYSAMKMVMEQLDGAYSICFLDADGNLYVARDPQGFKPLVVGEDKKGNVYFSSESCALDAMGVVNYRDVKPGEVLKVSEAKGLHGKQVLKPKKVTHCMFEFLYFARADSVMQGKLNSSVREKLGELLAKMHPVEADYVMPVPDSARSYALGYARASGIPLKEGLMKNRYVFRTFIMPTQKLREEAVRAKLNPIRRVVEGKRIVLLEDSIVRGTTLKTIVSLLRDAGAREVHVRVGCPPVIAPCYMGMDFPTYKELIAATHSVEEIRRIIGADTLGYTDVKALEEAIGLRGKLCMACVTNDYPLKKQPKDYKDIRIRCG